MNVELVLIGLQTLFLSLYGASGTAQFLSDKRRGWIAFTIVFLMVAFSCIFFKSQMKGSIQLILFLLLVLDYLLHSLIPSSKWKRALISSIITFMSCSLIFLQWQNVMVWVGVIPVVGLLFWLIKKWSVWFTKVREYFLKAGTIITLFFVLEPVLISIQQNLKPIATIPLSSIVNQQNFILLGVLVMLMLGGFVLKEKSRL